MKEKDTDTLERLDEFLSDNVIRKDKELCTLISLAIKICKEDVGDGKRR